MSRLARDREIEIAFIAISSVLVLAIFYSLVSVNGVVLGNDPSVHLQKAELFLQTGKIPIVNLGWTPPLYEILLAMLISFSGATGVVQMIFLVKALAVIIDWLLFLSVYLIASKFFNKKVGAIASVLLLMSFPMYEMNAFGGYTTVLGIAFLLLVLLYLPLAVENVGYLLVTFFAAFALVLSHQLAAFLAVFILPPILVYMLIKSRGAYLKTVIALVLGGGIAFFLYYFQALFAYIGIAIDYVFFAVKSYAYEIPDASFSTFLVNFGFILFFGVAGFFIGYFTLKSRKKLVFFAILALSFFVPLFFAESYLFGFYMPFEWLTYYLIAPLAIFAAVSLEFIAEKFFVFYTQNKKGARKNVLMIAAVFLILLVSLMAFARTDIVYGKISSTSVYYSTTDPKALDAGVWLEQNYPGGGTVVDTEVPGNWFADFCGKSIIAQTDPVIERNSIAESVLDLSYDIQDQQNLLRAYEAKGNTSDENYVSVNQVWYPASYTYLTINYVSFTQNGTQYEFPFTDLNRQVIFSEQSTPAQMVIRYFNDYVAVTEIMVVPNDNYAVNVTWAVSPLQGDISNVTLYLSCNIDIYHFFFDLVQVPGFMNWVDPWDMPTYAFGSDWCYVILNSTQLQNNYLGLYSDKNQTAYAFKFADLPDWVNVGALANKQIDAVRLDYQFNEINANETATKQYQLLMMTKSSFPSLQENNVESIFDLKPVQFAVSVDDYKDYIAQNNIEFVVYDKNELDPNFVRCSFLQLIYSNDRYAIFKVLRNYD